MKWWKRLGALLLTAVLIVGLCQVPGNEAKAETMYKITSFKLQGDVRELSSEQTTEKFVLADENPIMVASDGTVYFVYKSAPTTTKTTYKYIFNDIAIIETDPQGTVTPTNCRILVKKNNVISGTIIFTVDGTEINYQQVQVVPESERPNLEEKFEGKNPQITAFTVNDGTQIKNVPVKKVTVTNNPLSDEELASESELNAGTIDIELERPLTAADGVYQINFPSTNYKIEFKYPETYRTAKLSYNMEWLGMSKKPYVDIEAEKVDGTKQIFHYSVNMNIAAYLTTGLLSFDGYYKVSSYTERVDSETETEGKITLTTSKYSSDLCKMTVQPGYVAGSVLLFNSVQGGIPNTDETSKEYGYITPDDLNKGLSFTVKNAMGAQKTYTIQVNTPWALKWNDAINNQLKRVLMNNTEQQKALVSQGTWMANTLAKDSIVEVQLTPPQGEILDRVVLKTSDGQTVDATCKNGSFSFTMPNDVVTIESIQWKAGSYHKVNVSAKDTESKDIDSQYCTATVKVGDTEDTVAAAKDTVSLTPKTTEHPYYQYEFDHWDYDTAALSGVQEDAQTHTLTFTMPDQDVTVQAVYRKTGTQMTFQLKGANGGSFRGYMDTQGHYFEVSAEGQKYTDTFKPNAQINLQLSILNSTGYRFGGWTNENGEAWGENDATWSGDNPIITIGETSQTWVAEFKAKAFGKVTLKTADESQGTVTGTYKGTTGTTFGTVFEGEEVSLKATPKKGYLFDHWEVVAQDDTTRTVDGEGAEATLTREVGDDKDLTVTAVFKVDPEFKSDACEITNVELLDQSGKVVRAMTAQDGYTLTIALTKTDMSAADAEGLAQEGKYYLRITHSDKATVSHRTFDDANPIYPDLAWNKGNVTCPITVNSLGEEFVVTAENGTKKTYTIKITYESEKPVISDVTVERTKDTEAKVTFTSDTKGNYFYLYKKANVEAPTQDEVLASALKGSIGAGSSQTITLKDLNNTAYKVYLVVKGNMNGAMPSDVLEIDIPKLGAWTIGNSCSTSGGTVTVDKTRADAGETITVTVSPKAGMKLDTLNYSTDLAGSAPVSILDGKVSEGVYTFTMPTANITIGCTWSQTSEDDGPSITAFVVNGVSGTISQTAGTIKITLPYGTDLTSLKPEITFKNAKSVSPASGAAVNLTAPVTYTVTAEDGTTKTYTVTATVAEKSTSDKLWEDMLKQTGGSTDSSGKNTWWNKARDMKKNNNYPKYW